MVSETVHTIINLPLKRFKRYRRIEDFSVFTYKMAAENGGKQMTSLTVCKLIGRTSDTLQPSVWCDSPRRSARLAADCDNLQMMNDRCPASANRRPSAHNDIMTSVAHMQAVNVQYLQHPSMLLNRCTDCGPHPQTRGVALKSGGTPGTRLRVRQRFTVT